MSELLELIAGIRSGSAGLAPGTACKKVKYLWLESPKEIAYYTLLGYKVKHGILDTEFFPFSYHGYPLHVRGTRNKLIQIRQKFPEISKKEVLEMLDESH